MPGKAITDKQERPRSGGWQQGPEIGPSVMHQDDLGPARAIGMAGALLAVFGGMALWLNQTGWNARVSSSWASIFLTLGLAALLFHAAFDRDLQFRRVYLAFAFVSLIVGAFLCTLPYPRVGAQFSSGFLCMAMALLFFLAVHRNEDDPFVRNVLEWTLGGAGGLMAAIGLFGGNLRAEFLLPYGLLLSLLGLVYVGAFVATRGISEDLPYRAGLLLGLAGAVVFLVALGRSMLPGLLLRWKWTSTPSPEYLVPQGLLLMTVGVLYGAVSLGICSDRPLAVLTRRELGAFFYSPMAYLVLLAFSAASWYNYAGFIEVLARSKPGEARLFEPIVMRYAISWPTIIALVGAVTVLTMRLLSEEKRSGTFEVLLTAPVEETTVVLSKFLAAFVMYMVLWLPFGLYLVAIPIGGGKPFDYQPLLSFFFVVAITGAGFVSMGLFFSSLTRNQIASAVMTFVGMSLLTYATFEWGRLASGESKEGGWTAVFRHLSYILIWSDALEGRIVVKYLTFYASMPFLFLFMTVKVLESRKWR